MLSYDAAVQPPGAFPEEPTDSRSDEAAAIAPSRWGLDEGDVSLVLWKLSLTPTERLLAAEDFQRGIDALRRARRSQ